MGEIEVIQPNEEMLKIVREIIKQNNQIIELNKGIVSSITKPALIYKGEG